METPYGDNMEDDSSYNNTDCDFYDDCINGEDIGGEGGCFSCVHNLEEKC